MPLTLLTISKKYCHSERSIAVGEANGNAQSRDLLFAVGD
jgi:hypothetical protein